MIGKSVSAVIQVRKEAEHVLERLKSAGISRNNISALVFEGKANGDTKAGSLGWLGAAEVVSTPAMDTLMAIGPILRCLRRVGCDSAKAIAGAMAMLGIHESDARRYQDAIRLGGAWFSVIAFDSGEVDRARWIFADANAELISASRESRILEPTLNAAGLDPNSHRKRRKRFRLFSG